MSARSMSPVPTAEPNGSMSIGGTRITTEQAVFAFGFAAGVGTGLGQFIFSNRLSSSASDTVSLGSVIAPFGLAAVAPIAAPFLLDLLGE